MISKNLDNINLDNFPVAIFGSVPAGITTVLELEKKNIKYWKEFRFALQRWQGKSKIYFNQWKMLILNCGT